MPLRLHIKVVPNASRSRVVGWLGEALKVQVAAAPERGKANEALVALIAEVLQVKPGQVRVVAGFTQSRKTIEISGLEEADLRAKLPKRP